MGLINFRRGRVPPNDAQVRNMAGVEAIKLEHVEEEEDERYDAMTDAQREAYYVNPSIWTKLRKRTRGR